MIFLQEVNNFWYADPPYVPFGVISSGIPEEIPEEDISLISNINAIL